MKNYLLLAVFSLAFLVSNAQIKVDSSGRVGINQAAPAYNLDWYGTGRFWSGWGN